MSMGMELEATQSVSVPQPLPPRRPAGRASRRTLLPQVIDDRLMFVKVHMPWDMLCTYAEVLHIKLPIQPNDLSSRPSPWRLLSCVTKHFRPSEDLITKETEYFTAPFEKDRLEYFHIAQKDSFFTPSMRSRMVGIWSPGAGAGAGSLLIPASSQAYYLLCRAPYEIRGNAKKFGVSKLLDSGVYKAAYPLHDVRPPDRAARARSRAGPGG